VKQRTGQRFPDFFNRNKHDMTKYRIQIWGYLNQLEVNTSTVDVSRPDELNKHLLKMSRQYVLSKNMQNQVIKGHYTINT
jgi:hypothetical protein